MWSSLSLSRRLSPRGLAGPIAASAAACLVFAENRRSALACEESSSPDNATERARLQRKQTALQQASSNGSMPTARRFDTKKEVSEIRKGEKEMLQRWEKDEDGWRELPARAWPAYQPNPKQLRGIEAEVQEHGCSSDGRFTSDLCTELLFNVATALVFYNLDPERGLKQYEALAKQGHVDSMVACGIVLLEGMGVSPREQEGVQWLEKAAARNSAQGCYELGSVLYTGIDDVVEEDPQAAFELFRRAAEQDHTGGMYMMADCLLEGEGTEKNVGRAVPLFYNAAERGHRYSRQKIRELLKKY